MSAVPRPEGATAFAPASVGNVAIGFDILGFALGALGDRVTALLSGGGYAAYAVAAAPLCLPIPPGLSMVEAAAITRADSIRQIASI